MSEGEREGGRRGSEITLSDAQVLKLLQWSVFVTVPLRQILLRAGDGSQWVDHLPTMHKVLHLLS
jgi:hypothetical protein